MRVLRFDSLGGASGNMILGSLLELGVEADALRTALAALPIDDVEIRVEAAGTHGLHGTHVTVEAPEPHGGHAHRGLNDILPMIEGAALPEAVKKESSEVFRRLADAEAAVHRVSVDTIHFHEVGALDAIVDIVGACLAKSMLGIDHVDVRPLPIGSGTVRCAHGVYPVPAPAVVNLLREVEVVQTDESAELVTPTGAALLTTWQGGAVETPLRLEKAGYGFGTRTLTGRPNVLRASLLRSMDATETEAPTQCVLLSCNVDDATPEMIGPLFEDLLGQGALDVWTTPIGMKKNRPGCELSVLAPRHAQKVLEQTLFAECPTFGLRVQPMGRVVLERQMRTVQTPYGEIAIKLGFRQGTLLTASPEFEACRAAALSAGAPVRRVFESAQAAAQEFFRKSNETTSPGPST